MTNAVITAFTPTAAIQLDARGYHLLIAELEDHRDDDPDATAALVYRVELATAPRSDPSWDLGRVVTASDERIPGSCDRDALNASLASDDPVGFALGLAAIADYYGAESITSLQPERWTAAELASWPHRGDRRDGKPTAIARPRR